MWRAETFHFVELSQRNQWVVFLSENLMNKHFLLYLGHFLIFYFAFIYKYLSLCKKCVVKAQKSLKFVQLDFSLFTFSLEV